MSRIKFEPQQGMVLFAKNKRRVSAFYQATLGLRAVESESSHDLLRGATYEIVVHAIPRKIAAVIEIMNPPAPRDRAAIKPTFVVQSLDKVRDDAGKTGGFRQTSLGSVAFSRMLGTRRNGPRRQSGPIQTA